MKTIKIGNSEFDIVDMSEISIGDFEKISDEVLDETGKAQRRIVPWLSIIIKKWVKDGKEVELTEENIKSIQMKEAVEIMEKAGIVKEKDAKDLDIFKKKIDGKEQK